MSYANLSKILPTNSYHVSYSPTTCHTVATSASVWTVQSTHFFLPVCHFEQNAISLSFDVRLNPNKLRWVCDDEAYALVQFEVILSTLNFEQNLIPCITPPHWKAFGPPKDYFQSI
jgi:hypothetical protein